MDAHQFLTRAMDIASDNGQRGWLKQPILSGNADGAMIRQGRWTLGVTIEADVARLDTALDDRVEETATFTSGLADAYLPEIVAEYLR